MVNVTVILIHSTKPIERIFLEFLARYIKPLEYMVLGAH